MKIYKVAFIFCTTITIYASACNATENKTPYFTGNVIWEAGNDFAAGYFDVFYEDNLFYALPSLYSNNLENIIVNYKKISNCERRPPIVLSKLITTNQKDVSKSVNHVSLYKNGEIIGKLSDVSIDGVKSWRLPTYNEINKSSHSSKLSLGLCTNSLPNGNRNNDAYYSSGFPIMTYTRNRTDYGRSVTDHMYRYEKNKGWTTGGYDWKKAFVVLVRKPSKIEKKVFNKYSSENYKKRIYEYAKELTKELLKVQKESLDEPKILTTPSKPKLKKDEFETTATFNKKVNNAIKKWKEEIAVIEQKKSALKENYAMKQKEINLKYEQKVKHFTSQIYQEKIYKQSLEKALQMVLGKPYFKNIKYNADTQIMSIGVFSARTSAFYEDIEISVPIEKAKKLKNNLLYSNLIPMVKIDNKLNVISVDIVTNSEKIALDYLVAKNKHTITSYSNFISKYPKSSQANQASQAILNIREEQRILKQKRLAAERKRQKEKEEHARRKANAFSSEKSIGDKVCKDYSGMLFISGTLEGYVERISGNKIQIRISESSSFHSNDYPYNGLIWESYSSWRHCSY